MIKVLLLPDFHGKPPEFDGKGFDLILSPGDVCSTDMRKYMFQAITEGGNWYDILGKERAELEIRKSLKDGRQVLEKINEWGKVFSVPGNGDWTADKAKADGIEWDFLRKDHYQELIKGLENIVDCHFKLVDVGDYCIIGYGINSNPEIPQEPGDLEKKNPENLVEKIGFYQESLHKLGMLFEKAKKPVIFLSHNQPFGTDLDIVRWEASPMNGKHMGSVVVADCIRRYKPFLFVGGHMHENKGSCQMDKTVCVNSGLGPKDHVILELEKEKVMKIDIR